MRTTGSGIVPQLRLRLGPGAYRSALHQGAAARQPCGANPKALAPAWKEVTLPQISSYSRSAPQGRLRSRSDLRAAKESPSEFWTAVGTRGQAGDPDDELQIRGLLANHSGGAVNRARHDSASGFPVVFRAMQGLDCRRADRALAKCQSKPSVESPDSTGHLLRSISPLERL